MSLVNIIILEIPSFALIVIALLCDFDRLIASIQYPIINAS